MSTSNPASASTSDSASPAKQVVKINETIVSAQMIKRFEERSYVLSHFARTLLDLMCKDGSHFTEKGIFLYGEQRDWLIEEITKSKGKYARIAGAFKDSPFVGPPELTAEWLTELCTLAIN